MFTSIRAERLSVKTVYKLVFLGLIGSMVPLGLVVGFFALLGFDMVHLNGRSLHGIAGLIGGPIISVFVAMLFTAFMGSLIVLGLWLYSKFRPITICFKNVA
ncbi:hypothetical protein GN316_05075 [Xylophilus sp. Kf1]|nr:hypothetical protein [Xylophilus sp. Kf1]